MIRAYWESNGGLPVFGFPTTALATETNAEGFSGPTQWFERDRLEDHSAEGKGVLAGRLGAQKLALEGRPWESAPKVAGAAAGCVFFAETGHSLCPPFRAYWEQNGGLMRFGFPVGEPVTERNADGFTGTFQWFERRRMEVHPENQPPYNILLGLLGNEVRSAGSTPPPPPPPPPGPAAGQPSVFGVEINRGQVGAVAARAAEANVSWARYNGILWPEVEAARGARDWSVLRGVEDELRTMSANGMTPLVIVRGTPGWAQKVVGSTCGPIRADALGAFADFMRELVTRYSAPPFNVKYWELGNEPDVDPGLVGGDSPFGCWGDNSDEFYGGGYYAEMLKQVYPAVKQANPNAQIVIGGLLLDCDPTNPPANQTCKPAQFLEGILRNGGAAAFDIISYHAYTYWNAARTDKDLEHPAWRQRGGAMLGKLNFIRSVEARYNVNKPILMNEGSLLCYPGTPNCPGDALPGRPGELCRAYVHTRLGQRHHRRNLVHAQRLRLARGRDDRGQPASTTGLCDAQVPVDAFKGCDLHRTPGRGLARRLCLPCRWHDLSGLLDQ